MTSSVSSNDPSATVNVILNNVMGDLCNGRRRTYDSPAKPVEVTHAQCWQSASSESLCGDHQRQRQRNLQHSWRSSRSRFNGWLWPSTQCANANQLFNKRQKSAASTRTANTGCQQNF